ncbi:predicted protein [Botrytis cinerea T4]|uniref:Uncharacterized protein n=1 Tax=Botryotinia fuckeliana (strain T4) TaxID=999810 RepID=G2YP54_BOTF4|nr:predicted protein [Botrytis cinerea T4]
MNKWKSKHPSDLESVPNKKLKRFESKPSRSSRCRKKHLINGLLVMAR